MKTKINYGILGTGWISHIFADDLKHSTNSILYAVGSRNINNANAFAAKFKIPNVYGSYQDLLSDSNIDIVYIAGPHNFHFATCKLALDYGKNVICEKPFMVNEKEASAIIELAASKGLFVMEAMWSRFLPHMISIRELLQNKVIGDVQLLCADSGYMCDETDIKGKALNPAFAAGAILDVGVYPISLSQWIMGLPKTIQSHSKKAVTGVDVLTSMLFSYENQSSALLHAAITAPCASNGIILGSKGRIIIEREIWRPTSFIIELLNGDKQRHDFQTKGIGYHYEATAASECVLKGKVESNLMSHKDTLEVMQIMDTVRKQQGIIYPFE